MDQVAILECRNEWIRGIIDMKITFFKFHFIDKLENDFVSFAVVFCFAYVGIKSIRRNLNQASKPICTGEHKISFFCLFWCLPIVGKEIFYYLINRINIMKKEEEGSIYSCTNWIRYWCFDLLCSLNQFLRFRWK